MDDLLELTRLEESHIKLYVEDIEMESFLRSVEEEWRVRVELQGARMEVAAAGGSPIAADPYLLRRVFANLIGNALRHAGKAIRIELAAEDLATEGVRFTVRDDGSGIPPAFHDLIFLKFGSLQRQGSRPTSGLGLTFCKLAVEAHGGRIWVDSRDEFGTAFHFVIPRRPAPVGPAA
jgi:signal transduction histidine kinase